MTFQMPADNTDTASVLRDLEPQAPKNIKSIMIKAAQELEDYKSLCDDVANLLTESSALKIGQMDSQSRADEITTIIKNSVAGAIDRLRGKS